MPKAPQTFLVVLKGMVTTMKNRIVCLCLSLLVCASLLGACGLNTKPVTLEKSMVLPEDGMVSAAVMQRLKDENKVAVFSGESGQTHYEWTVFGEDVAEPADVNLGIVCMEETPDSITFRLLTDKPLGFSPVLSLYAAGIWDADRAVVYRHDGDRLVALCSASMTVSGSQSTVLNFSVTEIGTFTVRAETAPGSSFGGNRPISDGSGEGQDKYLTDPVPEGKPLPVDPEEQTVNQQRAFTCTFSIECTAVFNHLDQLEADKLDVLPKDGIIFPATVVTFYEGETVFDVLQRVCRENGIHLEATWTPLLGSSFIEGIHNLYEFDCGSGSGWMYRVDGWYPNYGCSRYALTDGAVVEWRYTCDLGADIGGNALTP